MKLCIISDTHGLLPELPECDIVLHCGDFSPTINHEINFQRIWHRDNFVEWVYSLKCNQFIYTSGNHDWLYYDNSSHNHRPYKDYSGMQLQHSKRIYLENDKVEIDGLKIWAFPWQLPFYNWSFNAPEEELRQIYSRVGEADADIIISHGPPYGYGDPGYKEAHVGSKALVELIDRVSPKLVCFGHTHEGYGIYQRGNTKLVNASLLNDAYKMVNKPVLIEI